MPLTHYTCEKVSFAYPERVKREAVIVPHFGRVVGKEQIELRTNQLIGFWRRRAPALRRAGWEVSEAGLVAMLQCRPATYTPAEYGRACGYVTVCPHCYARQVLSV